MKKDYIEHHFNVRELDNRFQIRITERCGLNIFCISIYELVDTGMIDEDQTVLEWRYIKNSVKSGYHSYINAENAAHNEYKSLVLKKAEQNKKH